MKIIAASDLHCDKRNDRNLNDLVKIQADVLIIGGDIAQTKKGIKDNLKILQSFNGLKLAYLGNHELRALNKSTLGDHYLEMSELFEEFDLKNILMGSEIFRELYLFPKVIIGLCGHNHRSGVLNLGNCTVYNTSGFYKNSGITEIML